jgi:hypothetical protein
MSAGLAPACNVFISAATALALLATPGMANLSAFGFRPAPGRHPPRGMFLN